MTDAQLPGYDTGADASRGHFHNFQTRVIRQRATIYEHTSELVNTTLTWKIKYKSKLNQIDFK